MDDMNSWEALSGYLGEDQTAALKDAEMERSKAASAFHALFTGDPVNGQIVLDAFRKKTIEATALPAQAVDGAAIAIELGRREGENGSYRWFQRMIKQGATINHGTRSTSPTG